MAAVPLLQLFSFWRVFCFFFFFFFFCNVQSRFLLMFCSEFVFAPPAEPFRCAGETILLCCCNDYRVETSKERERGTEGRVEIKWKTSVNKNTLQVPHHTSPTRVNEWKHTSPDQSRGRKHFKRRDELRSEWNYLVSSTIKVILLELERTVHPKITPFSLFPTFPNVFISRNLFTWGKKKPGAQSSGTLQWYVGKKNHDPQNVFNPQEKTLDTVPHLHVMASLPLSFLCVVWSLYKWNKDISSSTWAKTGWVYGTQDKPFFFKVSLGCRGSLFLGNLGGNTWGQGFKSRVKDQSTCSDKEVQVTQTWRLTASLGREAHTAHDSRGEGLVGHFRNHRVVPKQVTLWLRWVNASSSDLGVCIWKHRTKSV